MRSRWIGVLLALAVLPLIAGCFPTILSDQPLGDEIAVLDPEHLNGLWLFGRPGREDETGGFFVRVLDAQAGAMSIWSGGCEPPPPESREATVVLWRRQAVPKTCDGCYFHFAQFREEELSPSGKFSLTFFTLLSDGKSPAILYLVDKEADVRLLWLVGKGALPGRLESKKPEAPLVLGPLLPEHYHIILSAESGLFEWQKPIVFLKVPDELDPCKKPAQAK